MFEEAVLYYLTHEGLFVSPQFSIPGADGSEWSCPDIVGLDIQNRQVVVAEVSTASNISSLVEKVRNREEQWFRLLGEFLRSKGIITAEWSFKVWVFVKGDCVEQMKQAVGEPGDIAVTAIEEIAFPWRWNWPPALQR